MKSKKISLPTVYDVAELAGVSPSTVSRFLNRTTFVAADKSELIENAISTLGYKPSARQGVKSVSRTMTLGVLIQSAESPFSSEILLGMEKAVASRGYNLLIATGYWDNKAETKAMDKLISQKVDGIMTLTGTLSDDQINKYAKSTPIVAIGRQIESPQVASIKVDNSIGAYMATNHLIQQGHSRIVHLQGIISHADAQQRLEGYKRALRDAGLTINEKLIRKGEFEMKDSFDAVCRLIKEKHSFSAIFAANDQSAYGAMQALYQHDIRVPQDVSVVGFDDLIMSRYFIPPLTTIKQPLEGFGQAAVYTLLDVINGNKQPHPIPPVELKMRDSTAKFSLN
ncbi:substrate-binding domain-containing protein [Vibrio sp. S11_S32]|uniref:LacI family DNA-binding transcriptional regulator n=1 Tax=Vibrio sp. S11_S32 TaxID=2720225 RepID=UPI0016804342|nr:substrate-binding domain-containing protein [Vibrio sp. S11_S32]MBD1574874.1 substrate-binding domain-containing protein [Vibrio sp. S11_S32]